MYKRALRSEIERAIAFVEKTGKQGILQRTDFLTTYFGCDGKSFPGHVFHYGFNDDSHHWTHRRKDTWEKRGVAHPFKEIQQEFFAKGYYICDVSNPNKSFDIVIVVSKTVPKDSVKTLWHGLNTISS